MKFVEYKGVVPKKKKMYKLDAYLMEFINMDVAVVKVELGENEYKNSKSAYATIHKAIKRTAAPIIAKLSGDDIYLIRKDM